MEEGLSTFSIKQLENYSGIKAHTIRIWEKRYGILEPDRTDSNIRTYNETELKKILNVAYLKRNGFKISQIALLDEDALTQQVMTISSRNDKPDNFFEPGKALMPALKFNESKFKEALSPIIKSEGIESAYPLYLYPLLVKAGILWQTGSLSRAQEQFVRNTINQILVVEDDSLKSVMKQRTAVAMIKTSEYSSDNNFLFYKYLLKKNGYDVIYTGGVLPASEIVEIHKIKPFSILVVNSGSNDSAEKNIKYFSSLSKSLLIERIILADYPEEHEKRRSDNIIITREPEDFIRVVETLS